ncbi:MAG: Na(+)-translocating NADH-quinone reductase subunit A [Bacteroidales bacterium]|jgi:Na+-transporting NADH:ubiquinone oxidoreductase subunit A|nr:Na(+)-translocating NADH-quinone reductase subunit A [Bacteroidales bacterium]
MAKTYKIRKGLDIKLKGEPLPEMKGQISAKYFVLRPDDFFGIIPKLKLKKNDTVKRGEVVYFDKNIPEIFFTSPVSGKILDIIRGEKRKIIEIIIEADEKDELVKFDITNDFTDNPELLKNILLASGAWPLIKQRPYGIVANPNDKPRDIFISFFDSAPLTADFDFILKDKKEQINTALKALKNFTGSKLFLNFKKDSKLVDIIDNKGDYEINYFDGPHPAGLVGVQINHIKPVNKGDIVWTINAADLVIVGNILLTGEYYPERTVALSGSEIKNPGYYKIVAGSDIKEIIKNNTENNNYRVISGSVLTGRNVSDNPSLGFFDTTITVIPEGNHYEMFGWAAPGLNKLSNSKTFLSALIPNKKFEIDTNLHGGERAYVVTGEYEKVCPMDIYPQLLVKAVITEDIDKMEQLGIYEVIEEDLALCEFVCTSKIEVQSIIRSGLELIRKEMS